MEVFWEEREDVFWRGEAAVHHMPGEVVQSRHQLWGGKRTGAGLKSITYSTGRAFLARRHSLCCETHTTRALGIQVRPDSLSRAGFTELPSALGLAPSAHSFPPAAGKGRCYRARPVSAAAAEPRAFPRAWAAPRCAGPAHSRSLLPSFPPSGARGRPARPGPAVPAPLPPR